jgi:Alpha/beta hydrolase of unknown function (DUF900)
MTLLLSFRTAPVAGGNATPSEALELASPDGVLSFARVPFAELSQRAAGRNVLLATHGFNVHLEPGARSLARLEAQIAPTGQELFIGVLWPGDFWIPAVNYPFAGSPAMAAGRALALICNRWLTDAASLSFVSHSLGARVVLEATQNTTQVTRNLCMAAGAVNRDALVGQYAAAQKRATTISNLASDKDKVLKLAYPVGDLFANLLHDDHAFAKAALGRRGPARPMPSNVSPAEIPSGADYDHGNYLPPGDPAPTNDPTAKWIQAANFIARAFRREPQTWP